MRLGMGWGVAVSLALGAAVLALPGVRGRDGDKDEELAARIEAENNPVKKAKLEIQLGRLKLRHAVEACEKDDHPHCQEFLGSFLSLMKGSWNRLEATGRVAAKQVDGFKELDIALREGSRQLEDLKHRVPYQDMDEINSAQKETDQLRAKVLRALFPALDQPEGTKPERKRAHTSPAAGAAP
jgi:hypothetical protein